MNPSPAARPLQTRPRLVCFVNGIFGEGVGGGDIYFYFMARAVLDAGYPVHFFGGHAFKRYLEKQNLPLNITLTDSGPGNLGDVGTLSGQFRLLWDFGRRLVGTFPRLNEIKPDDIAYAMSDFWFDTIPLICCRARKKILYLGMIAPTFGQILFKHRADVTSIRLPSLYYWMSQQLSLRWFRHCRGGIVTYSHPEMRDYLKRFGYVESNLWYVPNGSDVTTAEHVPEQSKKFDLVWTGRVHPQKGVDDLLATLSWLKQRLPGFRAIVVGKSKDTLEPLARQLGLADNVFFSGLVSEEEKFRLLKSSRVFVMPSRYESWGIVVGEALACNIPVVAYELDAYRPVFGNLLHYVKPFEIEAFKQAVAAEIDASHAGTTKLDAALLAQFKREYSWVAVGIRFLNALRDLEARKIPPAKK